MQLVVGQRVKVKNDIFTYMLDGDSGTLMRVREAESGEAGTVVGVQDMPWGRTYTVRFDVNGCSDVDPREVEILS